MSEYSEPAIFSSSEIDQLREISDWRAAASVAHCWSVILLTWVVVSIWTVHDDILGL